MTAKFADLHDVAQVVAQHIRARAGISEVQVGMFEEPPHATSQPGVRLSLLYTTKNAAPRSEGISRGLGTLPGPLRLSCFYLLTTTPGADSGDPGAAHNALGRALRLLHEWPVLHLPLSACGTSHDQSPVQLGEGQLRLTLVALTMEQLAQIWLALRRPLQPCAVLEAGPIQLHSPSAGAGAGPPR